MKPDLIMVQAKSTDFPLWRFQLAKFRDQFAKVIIVFMNPNRGHDYSTFIKYALVHDDVTFIDSPAIRPGEDWRDVAVHAALDVSDSDWVWFTEPDFIYSDLFWKLIIDQLGHQDIDYFGSMFGGRLHPCNLLIKRKVLDQTSLDFSAKPDQGFDHFGQIQRDLENLPTRGGFVPETYAFGDDMLFVCEHLNGITHNFMLLSDGDSPNYQVERFSQYLKDSMDCGIVLDPAWRKLVVDYFYRTITTLPH